MWSRFKNFFQRGPAAFGLGWTAHQLLNYRGWQRRFRYLARDVPRLGAYARRLYDAIPFGAAAQYIRGFPRRFDLGFRRYFFDYRPPASVIATIGAAGMIGAASGFSSLSSIAANRQLALARQPGRFTIPASDRLAPYSGGDYGQIAPPYVYQPRGDRGGFALEPERDVPTWGLVKSRYPIRERSSGGLEYLPPLNRQHYGRGMYTELGRGFSTRMPPEMTVDLVTRFTHSQLGLNDMGGYRTMTVFIKLNQIYNLFSNFGAFSPSTYSQNAEFWFTFYDKVHVEAFDISYHIEPYKANALNSVAYFAAYVGDGFETVDEQLGLTSVADLSDWSSQLFGEGPFVFNLPANAVSAEKSFDFSWQIDCANDYGADVASDNRIDQKSDGTMVVAGDPKYYKVHVCCLNTTDNWTACFSGEVYLRQRCRFYDRKSLVHA